MTHTLAPYNHLLAGRDEPIIDPDLPIIDSAHHLFDRPSLRYMFDDYLADVRAGHRIVASIYVETLAFARPDGPELLRPLGEVEFANGIGAMGASGVYGDCRIGAAMVGFADLRSGDQVAELTRSRARHRARAISRRSSDSDRAPQQGNVALRDESAPNGPDEAPGVPTGPSASGSARTDL